ncbi:MAG: ATP-binding protein [Leptospiraceae bacterium]|nr:ATP-binding protein [Leptospiraceae bacterium]
MLKIKGNWKDDSNYSLSIIDNGIGIPQENLNRIYNPFFSTKPESGTGLGLGVVNKIVNLYNGKITVESEYKKGTKFTVTFPSQQEMS